MQRRARAVGTTVAGLAALIELRTFRDVPKASYHPKTLAALESRRLVSVRRNVVTLTARGRAVEAKSHALFDL